MSESGRNLDVYYMALERIVEGWPQIVPVGTKISNDAVSVEAGRGKGSIKRSRAIFTALIRDIEQAASAAKNPVGDQKVKLRRSRQTATEYRQAYEAALARELCLLNELFETKKKLAALTGERIIPLRTPPTESSD